MNPAAPHLPLAPALARDLRRRLGEGAVITDPHHLLVYEADGLPHYRRTPSGVVLPRDTDEAVFAVALLHGAGVPLVPRGAGTGLSGGALAAQGSVVVGTGRMRRILALDPAGRRARVQAGVLNADLSRAAAPHGLHYAPDPSSQTACTLGGNVAENSGGPHCLKYGVTSRYVTGLRVVASGGEVVDLGGVDGPPAPDLVGLFVGSEGCFGLVTEIEVGLVPAPEGVRTLLAAFDRLEDAGAAVSAIIARGLLPAALEILDRATINAVEGSIFAAGYPLAAAALVVEFDGVEAALDDEADRAAALCREHGATEIRRAREAGDRAQLWKGRKKAFGAMGRLAPDMVVQDATVPRSRLPEVLARISGIARTHGLTVANVFHAGDGNLHPNILFDRRDPDQVVRVERASREIMAVCVEAGGTITGEHGVGLDKRESMHLVHGPLELTAMDAVRRVFDPSGLWNPGKVLPDGIGPPRPEAPASRRGSPPAPSDLADLPGLEVSGAAEGGVTARPRDAEALAALLARATAEKWRVAPPGGRGRADVRIDPSALVGIEAYEPADLTVTAGAGTRTAVLAETVGAAGQWLPVDAPGVAEASLGALVAAGVSGALAGSHGALRDLVLGLTLVTGDGRVLRLGGRVVKNVAGFDLVRLVVGSRAGLGIITAVTLRLVPLPEVDRSWVIRSRRPEDLVEAALGAVALGPAVAAVEMGWSPEAAVLVVRSTGAAAAVADAEGRFRGALADATRVEGEAAVAARVEARAPLAGTGPCSRLEAPPGDLDGLLAAARLQADEVGGTSTGWLIVDRGEAWITLPDGAAAPPFVAEGTVARWSAGLRRAFDPGGVLPRGPFATTDEEAP